MMYDPYNEGKKTTKCDSICHCSFLDKLYSLTAWLQPQVFFSGPLGLLHYEKH